MENNGGNNAMNASTNLRQQIRDPLVAQNLQDQQQQTTTNNSSSNNGNENQQQFCLRWHNHQTSLLSTLPVLLDQSHLTDVTISAEGRTLRAHRVVLSACSSFFLEIFRTLETTHHPVIIIPGASFAAIVALLTFMYSGEVNVYEEQIPMLLSLAETLGIKGLADVHNNLQKFIKISQDKDATMASANKEDIEEKLSTPPSPQQSAQSACGNFSLPHTPLPSSLNNSLAAAASTFNPLLSSSLSPKLPLPLENLFLKSLQFYPNLMHQPLNFSQAALNKTSELLSKYQQQCNLYQANLGMNPKDLLPVLMHNTEDDSQLAKRFCSGLTEKKTTLNSQQQQQQHLQQQQQKDIKRLDKIVENLRGGVSGANTTQASANTGAANKLEKVTDNAATTSYSSPLHAQLSPLSIKTSLDNYTTNSAALMQAKSSMFSSPTATETTTPLHTHLPYNISAEDQLKLQQHLDKYAQSCARTMEAAAVAAAANENLKNDAARTAAATATTPPSPQTKTPSNSKLYATCFICHKQLSNQYNLRVHLETHQNVRYACNVCSHVSRSKDALRKHVSYRHPGAPSPCETEARRKRANKLLATQLTVANLAQTSPSSGEITPTSPNTLQHFQNAAATATNTPGNDLNCTENTHAALTAAQLTSAYQMFMPNQFHLAAVAANAAQQQQPQQQSSSSAVKSKDFITTHMDNEENCTANSEANSKANLNPTTTLATTTTPTSTFTTVNVTNSTTLTTSTELQTTTNNNSIINSGENRISPTPLNS